MVSERQGLNPQRFRPGSFGAPTAPGYTLPVAADRGRVDHDRLLRDSALELVRFREQALPAKFIRPQDCALGTLLVSGELARFLLRRFIQLERPVVVFIARPGSAKLSVDVDNGAGWSSIDALIKHPSVQAVNRSPGRPESTDRVQPARVSSQSG